MKYLFILSGVVCLSFMLLPACAPQVEEQAEPVAEEAPNTEAIAKEVRATVAKWGSAFNSGDLDALVSLYADDAVRMNPDMPADMGKEAIRAGIEKGLAQYGPYALQLELSAEDVRVDGERAVVRGRTEATFTHKESGEEIEVPTKWVEVHERQPDGSWKIIWDIWNRDSSLPKSLST